MNDVIQGEHTPLPDAAAVLLAAHAARGVPGFYDEDKALLIVHPPYVPRERAMDGEHIVLSTHRGVDGFADHATGCQATAWVLDGAHGAPDFFEIDTVYEPQPGSTLAADADRCAAAVAEWFSDPRPVAGAVLIAALAEYGITPLRDLFSYAVPLDPDVSPGAVWNGLHLLVADRNPSVDHVPAAHTGWAVWLHDANGEPVGEALYCTAGDRYVDCAADSQSAADAIADYLTTPADEHAGATATVTV